MKILVVSDTHKNFNVLKSIVDSNQDADMLIHLGDGEREFASVRELYPMMPMIYVAGNCDFGNHEKTHVAAACGIKIFCCHGHMYGVNSGLGMLAETAKQYGCRIALYGHTHVFRVEEVGGVRIMNPGSPSLPRGGNKPSYGIIDLDESGKIEMDIRGLEGEKS